MRSEATAGGYSVYRAALPIAARNARPRIPFADLTDTAPVEPASDRTRNGAMPGRFVSLDPWGHLVGEVVPRAPSARG